MNVDYSYSGYFILYVSFTPLYTCRQYKSCDYITVTWHGLLQNNACKGGRLVISIADPLQPSLAKVEFHILLLKCITVQLLLKHINYDMMWPFTMWDTVLQIQNHVKVVAAIKSMASTNYFVITSLLLKKDTPSTFGCRFVASSHLAALLQPDNNMISTDFGCGRCHVKDSVTDYELLMAWHRPEVKLNKVGLNYNIIEFL